MIISSDVLPEPDGPTTAIDCPRRDVEVDAAQDLDRAGAAVERESHVLQGYDGLAHVARLRCGWN